MQKNIENKDPFSEAIRQKLENHQSAVDPAIWEAIEAGVVAEKQKRRFPFVWWITTGLAAAVALLLFINLPVNQSESGIASAPESKEITKTVEQKVTQNEIFAATSDKNTRTQNQILSVEKSTYKEETPTTVSENHQLQVNIAQSNVELTEKATEITIVKIDSTNILAKAEIKPTKETITDSAITTSPTKAGEKLQLKSDDWTDPLKEKQKNGWELVAMVGSSGKSSSTTQATPVFDFSPRMGIVSAERASTYIFAPEDFSDKTYMAPVSAGIAVARAFNPKWSLETGITYSYLLTTFKNYSVSSELNLHYLGLPVRVVYSFINNNKWSFYTAAGGMIEKGIWSVYIQNQNNPNSTITTTVSDKINGWQYSLNASAGGAYTIYKNTALYFEPKISYYFDTNQPVSIRTATNIVIGFEGGLRYKF